PYPHDKEIQSHNEFKTQPACVTQYPESELRGQSTRRSMGLRNHLCAYEGRLALSGDGDGLIFQAGDWLGHVRSNDTSARHSGIETCIPDTAAHSGLDSSFRPGQPVCRPGLSSITA